MHPYRKLLVLALNELLRQNLLDLDPRQDRGPPGGYHLGDVAGAPSVINWWKADRDEVRISVWWKYDHGKHPAIDDDKAARDKLTTARPIAPRSSYCEFVGVVTSGWLERRSDPCLQGRGRKQLFDSYARPGELLLLAALPDPHPRGYRAEDPLQP